MFSLRKTEKPDITVKERAMENNRAVQRLLTVLAKSSDVSMKEWETELRGIRNG